ncbi:hypothetical protein [Ruegeria sp. ANG-R]|uniref:hypothetical protein n=1 Tax=Ruegeria sp. ANG-R TaxID=1577903 RepID=UPI000B00A230|nr:hypothetical protein [Ruegeria sp. ANG-R]
MFRSDDDFTRKPIRKKKQDELVPIDAGNDWKGEELIKGTRNKRPGEEGNMSNRSRKYG